MMENNKNKPLIYYYITSGGDNPVRNFIESLSYKQRAKVRRAFLAMEEYGRKMLLTFDILKDII